MSYLEDALKRAKDAQSGERPITKAMVSEALRQRGMNEPKKGGPSFDYDAAVERARQSQPPRSNSEEARDRLAASL